MNEIADAYKNSALLGKLNNYTSVKSHLQKGCYIEV